MVCEISPEMLKSEKKLISFSVVQTLLEQMLEISIVKEYQFEINEFELTVAIPFAIVDLMLFLETIEKILVHQ